MPTLRDAQEDYDVVVVGSGFGGAVSALRSAEKGYRVAVLEAGARFADDDFAHTNWDLRRYLFLPRLRMFGIQRLDLLRDVVVLSGAGVGGGSLVYGNTLYRPSRQFFADRQWAGITDWDEETGPFYDLATRMLGVTRTPRTTPADEALRRVAEEMGAGESFAPTPVGVFFGDAGSTPGSTEPDPYFGGAGPARRSCIDCGECMTGCRHGAKNTLVKNYLHLAEGVGVDVVPLATVRAVRPTGTGEWAVDVVPTAGPTRRGRTIRAGQVVLAASALGTARLLHRMRDEGVLPGLSDRLGHLTRTNSESILSAMAPGGETDFSTGVAITSTFRPDEHTSVEPCRYGRGSNAMALLQTALVPGGGVGTRLLAWARELLRDPRATLAAYDLRHWSERAVIALVMQDLDNSFTLRGRRGRLTRRWRLESRPGHGVPSPEWIPAGHETVRRMARIMGGTAHGNVGEAVGAPMTAHLIGGCVIGDTPAEGVVDAYHRVYGYPGLHVLDGSAIPANLGVNPALTITALAERAMAFWPNKGEEDERPDLGSSYRRIHPVPPHRPAVPQHASAALRLPVLQVRQSGPSGTSSDGVEVPAVRS